MSKSTKDRLRSILSDYRERLDRYAEMEKKHAAAAETERKLADQISEASEPDYRDVDALDRLDSLKRQQTACQAAKKDLADRLARRGAANNSFSFEAVQALTPLLWDELETLKKRITDRFLPFYSSRERAKQLAEKSDAAITSRRYIENLVNMSELMRGHERGGEDFAAQIERLVIEALKDAPDFEQFFPLRELVAGR